MRTGFALASLLLASCAITSTVGGKVTKPQYDFATFSVRAPKGDWGIAALEEMEEGMAFAQQRNALDGSTIQQTFMAVGKAPVEASKAEMSEGAIADQALEDDERGFGIIGKEGARKFTLKNVQKGTKTVGDKAVHFLQYEMDFGANIFGGTAGRTLVYVFFPADWQTRRAYYHFFIIETWQAGAIAASPDTGPLDALVTGFAIH
jgi:hypothetical protein